MGKTINLDKLEDLISEREKTAYTCQLMLSRLIHLGIKEMKIYLIKIKNNEIESSPESELIKMSEDYEAQENGIEYRLKFFISGNTIQWEIPPPVQTGRLIMEYLKKIGNGGKVNAVQNGNLYEIPISISRELRVENYEGEGIVIGTPQKIGVRKSYLPRVFKNWF